MLLAPDSCFRCGPPTQNLNPIRCRTGVTNFVDGPPPGQNSILTSFTKLPPSAALNPGSDPADSIAAASQGAVARIGAQPSNAFVV